MSGSCGCLDFCTGGNNMVWILLIMLLLGGNEGFSLCGGDNGMIWIILILVLAGGGSLGMCDTK